MPSIIFPGRYVVEYGVQYIETDTGSGFLKASVDLDGNGFSDFILADGSFPPDPIRETAGDILFQYENGFVLQKSAFTGTTHPREFSFVDLNADGILDIYVAAHGYDAPPFPGERNVIMLSTDLGYAESQPELTPSNGFTHSSTTGDIDGDGDIDILSVNLPGARLYLNDGYGFFVEATELLPNSITGIEASFSATSSLLHDIDGDGYFDIILGSQNSENSYSRIYFGAESGYSESNMLVLPDLSLYGRNQIIVDLKIFDIDLDGDDDLITSYTLNDPFYEGAGLQIFRNEGNRKFVDVSSNNFVDGSFNRNEDWIRFLNIVDFNEDGIQDIYLERGKFEPNSAVVYLGDGSGVFSPLYASDLLGDSGSYFLLGHTLPSFRDGKFELMGAQYFDGQLIVNRIQVDNPAVVEIDPKVTAGFLPGTSKNDLLTGGANNDYFIGGTGDDTIDGGGGVDVAAYAGSQNHYSLVLDSVSISVTDRRDFGYGTDELISIELLDFDTDLFGQPFNLTQFGGTTDLTADEFESFIELYIAYFNRAPDAIGLNFWGTAFTNGTSLEEIATLFVDQVETLAAYPLGTSNEVFAETVYNNVLGRTPDEAGFDFWVGQLDSDSVSRDQFILEVLRGVEAGSPDRAYLDDKVDIGAYFAVHKGMSDVDNASAAMAIFDGTAASIDASVAAIDDDYAGALDPDTGEFLMQVVGVLDDPFMMA